MQSWANSAAALCLVATGVAATPPRIVNVEDHLFARNDGTLLILREVRDNLGYHQVTRTDTMVVHRSLTDGADRGFAVVERVTDYGGDIDGRVTYDTPETARNPYEIREEQGAWPLNAATDGADGVSFDVHGLRLKARWHDRYFALPLADVQSLVNDTLLTVRSIAPAVESTLNEDSFDPFAFDVLAECTVTGLRTLYHQPADPALVHLSCEDRDTGQQAWLWVVVPQV